MSDSVKCHGCNNPAITKKGWCSRECYRKNQQLVSNTGRLKQGHILTEKHKETLKELGKAKKKDKEWVDAFVERVNRPQINAKKGHKKENHPRWILDRTQVKQLRGKGDELDFFKQILEERGYKCEITGEVGGKLSVHHIDSVHLYPEKKFCRGNVVVIKKDIHFDFHKKYGFQWATREKWIDYLIKNYNSPE